jgi:hypothetical protein
MKKIADFRALGTLALSLCLAGVAHAEPPSECNDDGRNERFYDLGVYKGVSLVNQAWASLEPDQCNHDKLLDFVGIVSAAFEAGAPAPDSPLAVYCHYTGSYVGAIERANEMANTCVEDCQLNGYMIGEMAAIFYCQLSIALGGLGLDDWVVEGDLTPCGEEFVAGCQDRFVELTQVYPSATDPRCLPYTPYYEPPYDENVYNTTKNNQCIYELEPAGG